MSDDKGKTEWSHDENEWPKPFAVTVGTGGVAMVIASWLAYGALFFWPSIPRPLAAALAFAILMTGHAMVPRWLRLPKAYRQFVQRHTALLAGFVVLNTAFFFALLARSAGWF